MFQNSSSPKVCIISPTPPLSLDPPLVVDMADPGAPRVKIPDVISRKPVVPGPNSWAQSRQQSTVHGPTTSGQLTNRDKYENMPMPLAPGDHSPNNTFLQPKTYIQPAIPLVNPVSRLKDQKNRAVTDPIAPKPLFASRKISISQLRNKTSNAEAKMESSKEASMPAEKTPAVQPTFKESTPKLGVDSAQNSEHKTPPTITPAANAPDTSCVSHKDSLKRVATSEQQDQLKPVAIRGYLREDQIKDPRVAGTSITPRDDVIEQSRIENKESRAPKVSTDGTLDPAKVETCDNIGEVGFVKANGMQRVESVMGIIETSSADENMKQVYSNPIDDVSQSSDGRTQKNVALVPPVAYSPSTYGGVWENDPAVVGNFHY